MILVDASAVVAAADRRDRQFNSASNAFRQARVPLIIPAPVSAEVDYLLDQRLGRRARLQFLADIAAGRLRVECLELTDYATILDLERRYEALNCGLADLSIVVLAARFKTRQVLTFDERHFRNIEPLQGGRFTILPADQDVAPH